MPQHDTAFLGPKTQFSRHAGAKVEASAEFFSTLLGIVVELDGRRHLADADAYRRRRRKDLLLQENGYFVPRFLADDVSEHLDEVLDAILRTLSHRRKVHSWECTGSPSAAVAVGGNG